MADAYRFVVGGAQVGLEDAGWAFEQVGWLAPEASSTPVYRLYNPWSHDHYYTADREEADGLVSEHGWEWDFDGEPAFYSAETSDHPVYQLFNPHETVGTHHWTTDHADEYLPLIGIGWQGEDAKFYAAALPEA